MTAWYWPVLQPVALSISSYQLTICHWHHSKGLVTSLHSHNYYKTKTKFPYISVLPLVFFCLFVFAVCFVFNFSHLPGTSELFSRTSQDITYTCFMCLGVLCICCRDCYRDVHYVCLFRNCWGFFFFEYFYNRSTWLIL